MARLRRKLTTTPRNPSIQRPQGFGRALLLSAAGGMALLGLFSLSHLVKLDSLLVASQAVFNVLSGVKGIGLGIVQLAHGLVQMLGFAALATVAVLASLAVISGSLQIALKLLPQLEGLWNLLAAGLNTITQMVSLPQRSLGAPASTNPSPATRSSSAKASEPHWHRAA